MSLPGLQAQTNCLIILNDEMMTSPRPCYDVYELTTFCVLIHTCMYVPSDDIIPWTERIFIQNKMVPG